MNSLVMLKTRPSVFGSFNLAAVSNFTVFAYIFIAVKVTENTRALEKASLHLPQRLLHPFPRFDEMLLQPVLAEGSATALRVLGLSMSASHKSLPTHVFWSHGVQQHIS